MKDLKDIFAAVSDRVAGLARNNAVVAKPISVGDRHILPLCELSVGFGGGGGTGEGEPVKPGDEQVTGSGGGAGGAAKASPVAVVVIENGKVHIEHLGQ
jgi:uncharacterized spore protein YtfJ